MNLNYKSNDKIGSEGSVCVPSSSSFSHFYSCSSFFVPHFFYILFLRQKLQLPAADDSAVSIFHQSEGETEGGRGEKFQMKITYSLIKLTRDSIKASCQSESDILLSGSVPFVGYIKRHIYRREGCTSRVRGTHVATFGKHQSKLTSSNLLKNWEASILGRSFTFSCSTHRVLVDKSCCPPFYAPHHHQTQRLLVWDLSCSHQNK